MTPEVAAGGRPTPPSEASRRLPLGVWILAGLTLLRAFSALAVLLWLDSLTTPSGIAAGLSDDAIRAILIGLVAVEATAAVGLVLRWRIAWVVVMLITGVSLAIGLLDVAGGAGGGLSLGIDVVTTLYLNQLAVRRVFGVDRAGRHVDLISIEEGER